MTCTVAMYESDLSCAHCHWNVVLEKKTWRVWFATVSCSESNELDAIQSCLLAKPKLECKKALEIAIVVKTASENLG